MAPSRRIRTTFPSALLSLLIGPVLASSACLGTTGPDCTANIVDGLIVRVHDSTTNLPVGEGATVTAQDGSHLETLRLTVGSFTFQGATERSGTYVVRVSKSGYQPWTRTGVVVTESECHVIQVEVVVKLQPIGA